jgi:hypothetical protein
MISIYVTCLVYIIWEVSKYISNIITNINAYIENYSPIVYFLLIIFLDLQNFIQIVYCLYIII